MKLMKNRNINKEVLTNYILHFVLYSKNTQYIVLSMSLWSEKIKKY